MVHAGRLKAGQGVVGRHPQPWGGLAVEVFLHWLWLKQGWGKSRDSVYWCQPAFYTIILLKSVCRCSKTAGRNSCPIVSGDVWNWSYRLTAHPLTSSHLSSAEQFFIREKHQKLGRPRKCLFERTSDRPVFARGCKLRHRWAPPTHRQHEWWRVCVCVCVCACVCDVFAIYDNNIWHRLIMIIIKNYYPIFHTNHTHTDDFPLYGYQFS